MVVIENLSKSELQLLNLITSIYKLLGLAPISLTESPVYRSRKKEINVKFSATSSSVIFNFIGLIVLLPLEIYYLYVQFSEGSHKEGVSHLRYHFDTFFRISVIFTQIILISIFSSKRNEIAAILNKILSFECEIVKNLGNLDQLHSGQYQQLIVFASYFFISMVLILNKFVNDEPLVATVNVIPKFVVRNLMIQYTILLIYIKNKFRSLNESLLALTNRNDQLCFPFISLFSAPSEENVLNFVKFIRKLHFSLSEIVESVTEFYSVPILVSLVYYCAGAVFVGYLLVSSVTDYLIEKKYSGGQMMKIEECIDNGLLFIMCIYPTIVLTNSVTAILAEIKRTNYIMYDLASVYSAHSGITYELQQFSLEILHQNFSFTAFEMVPLDNRQLTSVFSLMLTYIIILLQSDDREDLHHVHCHNTTHPCPETLKN